MTTFHYVIIILIAEALWSYLGDMTIVHTVTRKKGKAVIYGIASLTINYTVLAVIATHNWNTWMIVGAIAGDAMGTYVAASRKPRKKRKVLKRMQGVTTA
jgi:hypothetical protein